MTLTLTIIDKLHSLTNCDFGLEHRGLGLGLGIKSLALPRQLSPR